MANFLTKLTNVETLQVFLVQSLRIHYNLNVINEGPYCSLFFFSGVSCSFFSGIVNSVSAISLSDSLTATAIFSTGFSASGRSVAGDWIDWPPGFLSEMGSGEDIKYIRIPYKRPVSYHTQLKND